MKFEALTEEIQNADLTSAEAVAQFRNQFLGRKSGKITDLFKQMPTLAPEERKSFGAKINALKDLAEARLADAQTQTQPKSNDKSVDFTLPGTPIQLGSLHPLTQTLNDIKQFFAMLGFGVVESPEIESDWYNFTALNFPPEHPARDMQDTFFLQSDKSVLLRTHTSPGQIRALENADLPLRVIVPGRVYRNEAISYKSYCLFHQIEGLFVDEGVSFADLKQILRLFAEFIFGEGVKMRFRASYFPFTETSAEVDIWGKKPDGTEQWMEILGSGMVDPEVLKAVNIDPEKYTGYAFGMGLERITMLRYGITDIRVLYENDVRFLNQF